jgi:arginine/ornithine N-succinyltransferase beta subunit
MSSPDDLIIRPVLLQDAEALWTIARQEGVIETTMALPSLRLEQRMKSLSELEEAGEGLLLILKSSQKSQNSKHEREG